ISEGPKRASRSKIQREDQKFKIRDPIRAACMSLENFRGVKSCASHRTARLNSSRAQGRWRGLLCAGGASKCYGREGTGKQTKAGASSRSPNAGANDCAPVGTKFEFFDRCLLRLVFGHSCAPAYVDQREVSWRYLEMQMPRFCPTVL